MGLRGDGLDPAREARLSEAEARGVFPQCGKSLGESKTGTGAVNDGFFCNVACISAFCAPEYLERARRPRAERERATAQRRHFG